MSEDPPQAVRGRRSAASGSSLLCCGDLLAFDEPQVENRIPRQQVPVWRREGPHPRLTAWWPCRATGLRLLL